MHSSRKTLGFTMASTPAVSAALLSVNQADRVARSFTSYSVGVVRRGDGRIYLVKIGRKFEIHLRPEELTDDGIKASIAKNDPWPG